MNTKKKKKKKIHRIKHAVYVSRWILLAIPGKYLYLFILSLWDNVTGAFLLSQGVLGFFVFFIDHHIFKIDEYLLAWVMKDAPDSQKLHRL